MCTYLSQPVLQAAGRHDPITILRAATAVDAVQAFINDRPSFNLPRALSVFTEARVRYPILPSIRQPPVSKQSNSPTMNFTLISPCISRRSHNVGKAVLMSLLGTFNSSVQKPSSSALFATKSSWVACLYFTSADFQSFSSLSKPGRETDSRNDIHSSSSVHCIRLTASMHKRPNDMLTFVSLTCTVPKFSMAPCVRHCLVQRLKRLSHKWFQAALRPQSSSIVSSDPNQKLQSNDKSVHVWNFIVNTLHGAPKILSKVQVKYVCV